VGGVGEQRAVDDVGEASFEGADRFGLGVTACPAAFEELPRWRVVARLGDGDAVQCCVELPIPIRDSRCRVRLPDQTGTGAVPLWRA